MSLWYGLIAAGRDLVKYQDRDAKMWRINPFLKLLLFVLLLFLGLAFTNPLYNFAIFMVLLGICRYTGFPLREEMRRSKYAIIFIFIMVGLLQVINNPTLAGGGVWGFSYLFETFYPIQTWTLLWWNPILPIYVESVTFGAARFIYVVNMTVGVLILFKSSNMMDLLRTMRKLGVSYRIAFTTASAFRFIPYVASYMITTLEAMEARAYRFGKGSLRQKVDALKTLFLQLFTSLGRTAARMAIVTQARGVDFKSGTKTLFPSFELTNRDKAWLGGIIAMLVLGILGNILYGFGSVGEFILWLTRVGVLK